VGSQFWDLDFTQGASHDPGPGIFLAHDFQEMDGEPGDFTMSEGHKHPLGSYSNVHHKKYKGYRVEIFALSILRIHVPPTLSQ